MAKIRILVVDDAVVVRRLLTDMLSSDPALEVAGVAANGRIALARIPLINPDVVILDVEMPEMDGLETLRHLRKDHPRLPVIMFSTLTERGAAATLEALALGASDYVTKPANVGGINEGLKRVEEDLIPKIKCLVKFGVDPAAEPVPSSTAVPDRRPAIFVQRPPGFGPPSIIAIGSSTGGPNALADVIGELPGDMPFPILITQHMPPMFTRLLAERLNAKSPLAIVSMRSLRPLSSA